MPFWRGLRKRTGGLKHWTFGITGDSGIVIGRQLSDERLLRLKTAELFIFHPVTLEELA